MLHFGYWVLIFVACTVVLAWFLRRTTGTQVFVYWCITGALLAIGASMVWFTAQDPHQRAWVISVPQNIGWRIFGVGAAALVFGLVEFGFLRIIGLFRLGAITRITYYEALLQPFTLIIVGVGIAVIIIGGYLQYFTVNEDHKMFRDIAISFAFMFTLPIMIFASTKVIDEEIENRTMLTLMSKPIARWQVVLGKYFGVLLLCFAVITALGIMAGICSYIRYFDDMLTDYASGTDPAMLNYFNMQALRAIIPAMVLQFLQVATLTAVSVAVSTRFGLAVNITAVVIIYIASNMVRYATGSDLPMAVGIPLAGLANLLPGLSFLDLNQRLVYGNFSYGNQTYPGVPGYDLIWQYVGVAALYSAFYSAAALSFGIALFRTRELT